MGSSGVVTGPVKIRYNIRSLGYVLFVPFFIVVFYIYGDNHSRRYTSEDNRSIKKVHGQQKKSFSSCDLFSGRWVYDENNCSLYKDQSCSFMIDDYACEKHGRKDLKYQHWRWQPHGCQLPRFNATVFLEKLRNKRLIFVGDSLNKNQWISLLCMLESAIPLSTKLPEYRGSLITFTAIEYNATIDFYWAPLLVESNCDDILVHRVKNRVIRFNAIEKHAKHWNDADILVFDSYMWWLRPQMTLRWGSFEDPENSIYIKEARRPRHFEMALRTWSDWLDFNINRTKTKMFFMSPSPCHTVSDDWRATSGGNCYGETEPIMAEDFSGRCVERGLMQAAEAAIEELEFKRGLKIKYLNITQMSDLRKDAHPSVYRKHFTPPAKEQLLAPKTYSDCVHWCLPGVPDVWNELLFAYISSS